MWGNPCCGRLVPRRDAPRFLCFAARSSRRNHANIARHPTMAWTRLAPPKALQRLPADGPYPPVHMNPHFAEDRKTDSGSKLIVQGHATAPASAAISARARAG